MNEKRSGTGNTENSPCKECPERHAACWNECERYRAWLEHEHEAKARMKAVRRDANAKIKQEIRNSGRRIVPKQY